MMNKLSVVYRFSEPPYTSLSTNIDTSGYYQHGRYRDQCSTFQAIEKNSKPNHVVRISS